MIAPIVKSWDGWCELARSARALNQFRKAVIQGLKGQRTYAAPVINDGNAQVADFAKSGPIPDSGPSGYA